MASKAALDTGIYPVSAANSRLRCCSVSQRRNTAAAISKKPSHVARVESCAPVSAANRAYWEPLRKMSWVDLDTGNTTCRPSMMPSCTKPGT